MTIHYSLTFLLLAGEMLTFCILVAPLPFGIRKRMYTFLSTSSLVAKIAYGLKISFIFVAILFADAVQRMFRVSAETDVLKAGKGGAPDVRAESSMHARKFYAQRNVYLTGFCLFLSLVLTRTFYIVADLIHAQEEYTKLKQTSQTGTKSTDSGEVANLKKKITEYERKERDFETMKKQSAQLAKEYDRLASEHNQKTGNSSNKRVD